MIFFCDCIAIFLVFFVFEGLVVFWVRFVFIFILCGACKKIVVAWYDFDVKLVLEKLFWENEFVFRFLF